MGLEGATRLIGLASSDSRSDAAAAFPRQAKANRSIFYDKDGASKSVSDVYAGLVTRFDATTGRAAVAEADADAKISANPADGSPFPPTTPTRSNPADPSWASTAAPLRRRSPITSRRPGRSSWPPLRRTPRGPWSQKRHVDRPPVAGQDVSPASAPEATAPADEAASAGSLLASWLATSWAAPVRTGKNWGG